MVRHTTKSTACFSQVKQAAFLLSTEFSGGDPNGCTACRCGDALVEWQRQVRRLTNPHMHHRSRFNRPPPRECQARSPSARQPLRFPSCPSWSSWSSRQDSLRNQPGAASSRFCRTANRMNAEFHDRPLAIRPLFFVISFVSFVSFVVKQTGSPAKSARSRKIPVLPYGQSHEQGVPSPAARASLRRPATPRLPAPGLVISTWRQASRRS